MSLYRIRDGMGVGLEPVMGLLRLVRLSSHQAMVNLTQDYHCIILCRVINRVLRAADPALAKIVNQ